MAGRFDAIYREGTPPWDVGKPQAAFVELVEEGAITGWVIDVGCGTGENALFLASRGLDVVGVDAAPTAIERAHAKAGERGLAARFYVRDALALAAVDEPFDCAIDSGCFHVFSDAERVAYVRSVRGVLRERGRLFLMCFSEHQPGDWGPRRVTQRELRETFTGPFVIDEIRAAHFDVGPMIDAGPGILAWLALMTADGSGL